MPTSKDANSVPRFWDRYTHQLQSHGIKPSAAKWYVKRAEQFIAAFPNQRIRDLDPNQINDYLKSLAGMAASKTGNTVRPSMLYGRC